MTNVRERCARLGAALVGAAMLLTGLAAVAAERGAVLTSGYYITPETESEGGGSKIAFVVQADPKGSLPAWVVNLVAPKQAHNVTRLRKYLDRE